MARCSRRDRLPPSSTQLRCATADDDTDAWRLSYAGRRLSAVQTALCRLLFTLVGFFSLLLSAVTDPFIPRLPSRLFQRAELLHAALPTFGGLLPSELAIVYLCSMLHRYARGTLVPLRAAADSSSAGSGAGGGLLGGSGAMSGAAMSGAAMSGSGSGGSGGGAATGGGGGGPASSGSGGGYNAHSNGALEALEAFDGGAPARDSLCFVAGGEASDDTCCFYTLAQ